CWGGRLRTRSRGGSHRQPSIPSSPCKNRSPALPTSNLPPTPRSNLMSAAPHGRRRRSRVMNKTIAALVVAAAAAGVTIARADQGEDTGMGGHHRHRRGPSQAQLLEKYDANHNGVLDPEEKAAARAD